MRSRLLIAAIGLSLAGPMGLVAQDGGPRAAVDALFDAMRAADPDAALAVLAPDVRFAVVSPDGSGIAVQTLDGFLDAMGQSAGGWDEQIYDVEVHVDGGVASAWAPFTFYLNGELSHCGVNSIELLREASGWKITQISDTRRMAGCPDPLAG